MAKSWDVLKMGTGASPQGRELVELTADIHRLASRVDHLLRALFAKRRPSCANALASSRGVNSPFG
jgi:hypothetical protein